MKRLVRFQQDIFAMANVNYRYTGLSCNIWSDGQGYKRNKPDSLPRVKLEKNNDWLSISIESEPKVLAPKGNWRKRYKKDTVDAFEEGIEYVGRNYDLFLQHYNDTDFSFGDRELINSLEARGEYK